MAPLATPRSAPRYKLYYFDIQGRAEVIRLVFKAAGVPFIDSRVSQDQWPDFKPKTPFGSMPVLEMDGQKFGESGAILRWAARKFGLGGKTDADSLVADAVISQASELLDQFIGVFFCQDPAEKEQRTIKLKASANTFFSRWNSVARDIKSTNRTYTYLLGNSLTVADLQIFQTMCQLEPLMDMSAYSKLVNLKSTVQNVQSLKDHLAKRKPDP